MIITGACGKKYLEMSKYTVPLMEKYAAQYNLPFSFFVLDPSSRPPSWYKIPLLIEAIQTYSQVL